MECNSHVIASMDVLYAAGNLPGSPRFSSGIWNSIHIELVSRSADRSSAKAVDVVKRDDIPRPFRFSIEE
jgi:hypothetical protein